MRQNASRHVEDAVDIDPEHAIPVLDRQIQKKAPRPPTPALLTRMSILPNRRRVSAVSCATSSTFETSEAWIRQRSLPGSVGPPPVWRACDRSIRRRLPRRENAAPPRRQCPNRRPLRRLLFHCTAQGPSFFPSDDRITGAP